MEKVRQKYKSKEGKGRRKKERGWKREEGRGKGKKREMSKGEDNDEPTICVSPPGCATGRLRPATPIHY